MNSRTCTYCEEAKSVESFYTKTSAGKKYLSSVCKQCDIKRVAERKKEIIKDPYERAKINLQARNCYARGRRIDRATNIVRDSRKSDRKKKRQHDLTIGFVRELIRDGCLYCGANEGVLMTVDRIDNTIGHLQTNIVPACFECNLTRGTMPYAAWQLLAVGMRKARELGLLNGWKLGPLAHSGERLVCNQEATGA